MLILAQSTDAIEVVLGAAPTAQLPVLASYRDITTTTYTPGRSAVMTNGVTAVDAVPGPAAATQRVVDFMSIFNPNVANADVRVIYDINDVEFEIIRVTLAYRERLEFVEGRGWTVYTNAGSAKTSLNQGANAVQSGESIAVLNADIVNANAAANTLMDITGLEFPGVTGQRYWFEFFIHYTSAATTTGARFTINGPSYSELVYDSEISLSTTSESVNRSMNTYQMPTSPNASSGITGSNLARIRGIVRPNADASIIARFSSEIASSAITAKAGSFVRYRTL